MLEFSFVELVEEIRPHANFTLKLGTPDPSMFTRVRVEVPALIFFDVDDLQPRMIKYPTKGLLGTIIEYVPDDASKADDKLFVVPQCYESNVGGSDAGLGSVMVPDEVPPSPYPNTTATTSAGSGKRRALRTQNVKAGVPYSQGNRTSAAHVRATARTMKAQAKARAMQTQASIARQCYQFSDGAYDTSSPLSSDLLADGGRSTTVNTDDGCVSLEGISYSDATCQGDSILYDQKNYAGASLTIPITASGIAAGEVVSGNANVNDGAATPALTFDLTDNQLCVCSATLFVFSEKNYGGTFCSYAGSSVLGGHNMPGGCDNIWTTAGGSAGTTPAANGRYARSTMRTEIATDLRTTIWATPTPMGTSKGKSVMSGRTTTI